MKKCFSALLIVFLLLWYLPSCRLTEAKETNLDICGVRYQILLSPGISSAYSDEDLSFAASPGEGHSIDLSGLKGCTAIHTLSFRLYEKAAKIVIPYLPELDMIRVECPYTDTFSFDEPNDNVSIVFTGLLKNYTSTRTPERFVFEGGFDPSAFSQGQRIKDLELWKVTDLAAVRSLSPMRLTLNGTGWDLVGLQGWDLDTLVLEGDPLADLSPVSEGSIRSLILHSAPSLRGLEKSGIETLQISDSVTKDVSSLPEIGSLKTLILLVEETESNRHCVFTDSAAYRDSPPDTPLDPEILLAFLAKGGVIETIVRISQS